MRRWWGFLPFGAVSVIHLAALALGSQVIATPTKALLMPALLLALLVGLPRIRSEIALWAGLALVFSTAGDILLGVPGEIAFLVGVGAFSLAHVAYLFLYLRPLRTRAIGWRGLFYVAWLGILLLVLLPHIGPLTLPLAAYGLLLCGAAAAALGTTPIIATGALLFLTSDTLLSLKFFVPGFSLWQEDVLIMLVYLAAQGLIIAGTVLAAQRRAAAPLPT
ncbi:putative membrane protein YhhN [Leifsonia sp. AK011]|uniref:lysoplasmalogenase family protein n=1 Tax=Leifsonia sp. AK011 TaxID=2723075 RepID=UPI0015CB5F4C|nr:lysoplasmalogenase family protein [Leifsonia sp. AK011]NYF10452.1 putative membrane protein YhhN [Leifsonia sp. AK011]